LTGEKVTGEAKGEDAKSAEGRRDGETERTGLGAPLRCGSTTGSLRLLALPLSHPHNLGNGYSDDVPQDHATFWDRVVDLEHRQFLTPWSRQVDQLAVDQESLLRVAGLKGNLGPSVSLSASCSDEPDHL
jgi:hypothetical protein